MTDIVQDTGLMTLEEARQLTDSLKQAFMWLETKVEDILTGKPWLALEYPTLTAWWDGEGLTAFRLQADMRQQLAVAMYAEPDVTIANVGDALGVSYSTVRNDLASPNSNSANSDSGRTGQSAVSFTPTFSDLVNQFTPEVETQVDEPAPDIKAEVAEVIELSTWSDEELRMKSRVELGYAVLVNQRLNTDHPNLMAWAKQHNIYVNIGRKGDSGPAGVTGSDWGNPYLMPEDGDRFAVIRHYNEHWLDFKPSLLANLPLLKGKVLACWCAPKACHGDVLTHRVAELVEINTFDGAVA